MKFLPDVNNVKIKRDLHTDFPPQFKEKEGIKYVVGRIANF